MGLQSLPVLNKIGRSIHYPFICNSVLLLKFFNKIFLILRLFFFTIFTNYNLTFNIYLYYCNNTIKTLTSTDIIYNLHFFHIFFLRNYLCKVTLFRLESWLFIVFYTTLLSKTLDTYYNFSKYRFVYTYPTIRSIASFYDEL